MAAARPSRALIAGAAEHAIVDPDFACSPYIQRAKDAKPDAVFIFVPAGAQSIAVMKAQAKRRIVEHRVRQIR